MSRSAKTFLYLAPWAAVIFLCSYFAPYCGNDYRYLLVQGSDELVSSVSDIFISQYRHYFEWGGRTVNHLLAQYLLYIGKPWQSIITAAGFIGVIYAVCWLGTGRVTLRQPLSRLIFVTLLLWLCLRNFGEVVINVVSGCNYLFSTLWVMLFLLPFRQSLSAEDRTRSPLFALLMLLWGIIAGWTNENTGCAAVCVVGLYNLKLLKEKRIRLWQVTGGLGLLCGYALLMLAPGNEARLEFIEDKGFSFGQHFVHSSLPVIGESLLSQHLLIIALLMTLLCLKRHALLSLERPAVKAGAWLCAAGFISLFIMLLSPTIPARAAAPFTMLTLAGVIALQQELHQRSLTLLPKGAAAVLSILGLLFAAATAFNAVQGYRQAYFDNQARGQEIIAQLRAGRRDLTLHPLHVSSTRYLYVADVTTDPQNWTNVLISHYYGLNSVRGLCDPPHLGEAHDFIFLARLGRPVCQVPEEGAQHTE